MKITFCGANQEVTGSCYHLQSGNTQILVDCGIFQGGKYAEDKNEMPFPFQPSELEAVFVTHAHFDHIGRIPKLYKEGFRGKIYATKPTQELAMIVLKDGAHLMQDEAERHHHDALYSEEDVERIRELWQPVEYDQVYAAIPDFKVVFFDAGHILGSASIGVTADERTVVFSGDIGNTPVPLLPPFEHIKSADVIIMESTYGNRVHEPVNQRQQMLRQVILNTVAEKGVLLIPAFALERSQELLYELHHLHNSGQIPANLPIFLDSPMAIAATQVFAQCVDYLNTEARQEIAQGEELFNFPGLSFTERSEESKAILKVKSPKVIIAGSGMMNGGRIMHHLKNYLGDQNTTVFIIGYQVQGSLGRQLHHGNRSVEIYGIDIEVKAKVVSCGAFSGHADYPRLMNWLNSFESNPPRKVYVTHGELNSALSFSQSIEDQLGIASAVPKYGEVIDANSLVEVNAKDEFLPEVAPENSDAPAEPH